MKFLAEYIDILLTKVYNSIQQEGVVGRQAFVPTIMQVIPIRNLFRQMRKSAHGSLDFRKISE